MLGLSLRVEFLGDHMPGTAISLRTSDKQGAAERSADYILSITYPTADVLTALKAIGSKRTARPIVLMGERGRGKSHIMAVMHHAVSSPEVVEDWLRDWGQRLGSADLQSAQMLKGYIAISEPVHNHEYPFLWDLLFDRHPKGQYYRGQFESMSQPFPPRSLLEKMLADQPTCLILDEFQTWFMGLPERDPKSGLLVRQYAFNFLQVLSELAKERPEIFILVISVLNNQNDAFQQVHRQGPVVVDFRGPSARTDRQSLLLHRLFENRRNIPQADVDKLVNSYANERFRLLHSTKPESERGRICRDVSECWPFSPELIDLLESHILFSSAAQETRDLIRILAQVYRSRGESVPLVTPADFFVDSSSGQVQTLIDSIADSSNQDRLRQFAQVNLQAVVESGGAVPHARELVSAIWMRSLSLGKVVGGTPPEIHLDITRLSPIDDNAFQSELALLIENSVNIHGDEIPGGPLRFGVTENPRSKVRACGKNRRLWDPDAIPSAGQAVHPGKDILHIRRTLSHILNPETSQPKSRTVVLGPNWRNDPWADLDESERPDKWDRPVLAIIPDQIEGGQAELGRTLGPWLASHVQKRRNTVRFLLPAPGATGIFSDPDLVFSARCSYLCSREGWGTDPVYKGLHQEFDRPLRSALKSRFSRYAVLRKWNYQTPDNCVFEMERFNAQGADIPGAVEDAVLADLFDRDVFRRFVIQHAQDSEFVGSLMDDLVEPPPPNKGDAIPFLGEVRTYEMILGIAATGAIVLNVGGTWIGRRPEDTTEEDAIRFIRSKAYRSGLEMRQVQLGLPGAVGGGTVTVPGSTPAIGSTVTPAGKAESPLDAVTTAHSPQSSGSNSSEQGDHVGEGGDQPVDHKDGADPQPRRQTRRTDEPSTGINLSGCFETWGIDAGQCIESASIQFRGLTAQQIKQVLQRIPSAFRATLEVAYMDGDGNGQ